MAKKLKVERSELTEDEKSALAEARKTVQTLSNKGTFKGAYEMVRRGTVQIEKSNESHADKKEALRVLLEEVADFIA
jgi:hypothetical protein